MTLEDHLKGRKVVYVARRGDLFKIGCSGDICRRYPSAQSLKEICFVIPVPDEMSVYEAERQVHQLMRSKNVGGYEMFRLSEQDLSDLERASFVNYKLEVEIEDISLRPVR